MKHYYFSAILIDGYVAMDIFVFLCELYVFVLFVDN